MIHEWEPLASENIFFCKGTIPWSFLNFARGNREALALDILIAWKTDYIRSYITNQNFHSKICDRIKYVNLHLFLVSFHTILKRELRVAPFGVLLLWIACSTTLLFVFLVIFAILQCCYSGNFYMIPSCDEFHIPIYASTKRLGAYLIF